MTYGRSCLRQFLVRRETAAVSHLAELVRGDFFAQRPPHPAFGHLLPKGEGS